MLPSYVRPWIGAFLVVGLGVILWLAELDDLQPGNGQVERTWVAAYLSDQQQVAQSASIRLERLAAVRFWFSRPAAAARGTIVLRLRAPDGDNDLAVARRPVAELAVDGPTIFWLSPMRNDPPGGDSAMPLELRLETEGVDRSSAIEVFGGNNRYDGGVLIRNGRPIPSADLAFEPLYDARWFDRFFPITRIARGRPGILGWPPLYAILVYGVLVTIGFFLSRLARAS